MIILEKNQKFLTYLGVVIAVILIIVLIALIYPKIKKSSLTNATFANNIRELMNVGSANFMND